MRISGLIITEEMVPHIKEMLESAGIKVEKEINSEEGQTSKAPSVPDQTPYLMEQPNFHLRCEDQEGYQVILDFGRILMKPYPLSVAIRPKPHSSFLKSLIKPDNNKLVGPIIKILKEHGAKEFDVLGGKAACGSLQG